MRGATAGAGARVGGKRSLTSKRAALLATVCLTPLFAATDVRAAVQADRPVHHRAASATAASGGTIEAIRVEGNRRIERGTIVSYMLVAPGEPFDQGALDRSLKTLYATGLFKDVSLSRDGDTLVVHVVENPIVNRIVFEGNHAITDDKLHDALTLRPRAVFTTEMAENDREKILEAYAAGGRFAASVTPQIIRLGDNRVDVVFDIHEGALTLIRRISFVGNHAFSEAKLRSVISSAQTSLFTLFGNSDEYNPQRLDFDKEQLRRFYLRNGYIDFHVLDATAELAPDRKSFFITFTVQEGARFRLSSVKVTSTVRGLAPATVHDLVLVKKGQWYDGDAVQRTADDMQEVLQGRGFPFAEIKPQIAKNPNDTVDLIFPIDNGPRIYIERIEINGNTRTEDKVIRREFPFAEGDPFTDNQSRRAKQSLEDLGYFQTVSIDRTPGSAADKTIVNANLSEKATGELTLGGGYSTDAGALANVGLRQKNFIGTGIDAGINGTIAQYENQVDLSVTDPYFLDRNLVAGADIYRTANDYAALGYADYNETRYGATFRIGYAFNNYLAQSWNYSIVHRNVSDVNGTYSSIYVVDESGSSLLSQIGQTLTFDTRNSRVDPHSGAVLRLGTDLAGLGGNENYVRVKLDGGYYIPLDYLTGNRLWTLVERAGTGYIADYGGGRQSLIDNFYLGGDTLRGFLDGGVGPHSVPVQAYPAADSLGGRFIYTESTELHYPLPLPPDLGVSGRAFVDVGGLAGIRTNAKQVNVQDIQPIAGDDLSPRIGIGVGVSWKSPFGLINVDVAAPVKKQEYDQTQVFRFGFGTNF